jgi:ribosomal protein S18 acetylase RimI-like enzyme
MSEKSEVVIKKATKEDFDILHEMALEFTKFSVEKSGDPDEFYYQGWEEGFKDEINESLADKDSFFYIAYVDDSPAGYILCRYCDSCFKFEIDELYVDSKFRSLGIGKKLLERAVETGKKYKAPITLEVYEWNQDAHGFYSNYGFSPNGNILKLKL